MFMSTLESVSADGYALTFIAYGLTAREAEDLIVERALDYSRRYNEHPDDILDGEWNTTRRNDHV